MRVQSYVQERVSIQCGSLLSFETRMPSLQPDSEMAEATRRLHQEYHDRVNELLPRYSYRVWPYETLYVLESAFNITADSDTEGQL